MDCKKPARLPDRLHIFNDRGACHERILPPFAAMVSSCCRNITLSWIQSRTLAAPRQGAPRPRPASCRIGPPTISPMGTTSAQLGPRSRSPRRLEPGLRRNPPCESGPAPLISASRRELHLRSQHLPTQNSLLATAHGLNVSELINMPARGAAVEKGISHDQSSDHRR